MAMDQGQEQMMAEGQGEQPQGGGVAEFVQNLGQGLTTLAEMVGKTEGAPPEAGQLVQGIMQQFEQLVQVMAGGGGAQPEERPSRAVPVNQPEGTPIG